jgi:hypothetical protein
VNLGEDLPVRTSGVFMIFLVVAQLLILVAAFAAPNTDSSSPSRVGQVLSIGACACLLLFAVLIAYTWFGPIGTLADVEALRNAADPAMIARNLSLALNIMLLATGRGRLQRPSPDDGRDRVGPPSRLRCHLNPRYFEYGSSQLRYGKNSGFAKPRSQLAPIKASA